MAGNEISKNVYVSNAVKVMFMGGSVEIKSGGKYIKDGEERISKPSVKLTGIEVSQWGTVDPSVFRSMICTISADQAAMKKLSEISQ